MKVVCQNCNATYAINDAAIPPKGARAQCPRCKHLQQVKKPEAGAEAGAPAAPPPAPPPAAPPPAVRAAPAPPPRAAPAAPPAASADPFADLDLGSPAPPPARPAPAAAPPVGDDPFSNLDLSGPPSPPPAAPRAPAPPPGRPNSDPFANLDLGGPPSPPPARPVSAVRPPPASNGVARPPSSADHDPFAHLDLGAPAAPSAPAAPPPARPPAAPAGRPPPAAPQGRPESDPFANLDLGGNAAAPPPPPAAAPAAEAGPAPLGKCRSCGKLIFDPFDAALGTCESCRTKEQSEATGSAEPVERTSTPEPPPKAPPVAERPKPPADNRPKQNTNPSPMRQQHSGSKAPLLLGLLVVALLAGAGGLYVVKPPFIADLLKPKEKPTLVPAALQKQINLWAVANPEVAGTFAEHIKSAREHLALDRITDYRMAEGEYRKAALQAGTNAPQLAQAAAGVVEAYVLGRGEFRDKGSEQEMSDVMEGALALAPNQDSVQRAYAYYLLRDGKEKVDEARKAAKAAYDAAPLDGKAEALLVQGVTYLDSAQVAYDFLDRALQADPKLRRAYYYRALAEARVGRYAKAVADFNKRLELDPDARRSLVEIAKIYVSVGEVGQAKKSLQSVLQKEQYAPEAVLALAVIGYQVEGNLREAEKQIDSLLNADTKPKEPILLAALTHGAAVARERGDNKKAVDRLDKAFKINERYAPALYQRVLVALAANKPAEADSYLSKLVAIAPEGVRIEALQGRVACAEERPQECLSRFREAIAKNPQDLRSALLGAALISKADQSNEAYGLMTKALEIDPLIESRHRGTTEYYESIKSEYAGLAGGFDKEEKSSGQPIAYAGVLRYHRGDSTSAESHYFDALKIEPGNVAALNYLAQLYLDRKKAPKAQEYAQKALDSERLSALGKYLLGEAYEAQGNAEDARRMYSETLTQSPGFTGAMLRQGRLLAAQNKSDEAQAMLLKVFFADSDDTEARAALYKLGY